MACLATSLITAAAAIRAHPSSAVIPHWSPNHETLSCPWSGHRPTGQHPDGNAGDRPATRGASGMNSVAQVSAVPQGGGISFFERYLTVWVMLCIVVGILLGQGMLGVFQGIAALEVAQVNLPV